MIRKAFKFSILLALALCASAQTLRLGTSSFAATPGGQTGIQVYLDGAGIGAGQFTLGGSSIPKLTAIAGRAGASTLAASKTGSCSPLGAKSITVTCQVSGMNLNLIAPTPTSFGSTLMDVVLTWGPNAIGGSTLILSSPIASAPDGTAISITAGVPRQLDFNGGDSVNPPPPPPPPPPSTNNCDLNKDGKIDQADVFIAIGNLLTGAKDLSYLGKVVSAANGGACGL